jgi:MazG family protein
MTPSKDISRLIEIMAALRDPDGGCPWDLKQTFTTIAPYTIEEAYEVADAIARGDLDELKDELGDLLLQVVYHARMAEERGAFAFADVVEAITAKMIRRHPHVFGTAEERTAGAAPGFWDRAKAAEKSANTNAGLLDDVPVALPALTRAIKLQNKAAKVGFDWPSLTPVLSKLKEELAELEEAIESNPKEGTGRHAIEEEFGDLLFVIANVARHLKIDPESAQRAANEKFIRRFRYIEARLGEHGRSPAQSDLAEMDALWDAAKTKCL